MFIIPVIYENQSYVSGVFPGDSSDVWVDYFNPNMTLSGGKNHTIRVPSLSYFPVFQKKGAILPLHVSTPLAYHGDSASKTALTFCVNYPDTDQFVSNELHERESSGVRTHYSFTRKADVGGEAFGDLEFTVSAWSKMYNSQKAMDTAFLLRGVKVTSDTNVSVKGRETKSTSQEGTATYVEISLPRVASRKFDAVETIFPYGAPESFSQSVSTVDRIFDRPSDDVPFWVEQPHWFAAQSHESASGVDELFIRSGDPSEGQIVKISNVLIVSSN